MLPFIMVANEHCIYVSVISPISNSVLRGLALSLP